jgi:hypothetical protein
MTSLKGGRRWLVIGVAAGACLAIAVLASGALRQASQAITSPSEPCAPHPCSAPHGFHVAIGNIATAHGIVRLEVSFANHTTADTFYAVSYRHTSPADFQLRSKDGHQARPRFDSQCPDWGELKIERGASAGPKSLCFATPAAGLQGAEIIWSPDLGLLFDDVQIPLGQG